MEVAVVARVDAVELSEDVAVMSPARVEASEVVDVDAKEADVVPVEVVLEAVLKAVPRVDVVVPGGILIRNPSKLA